MNFWKDIGANDFILDTIENGYKLPLIQTPEPAVFKNNKSALANPEFVTEAIQELVSTNRVLEVPFRPKVENPLSVASNKDKNRLILDLRYVNLHLRKEKTKFEDWETFQNYLCKDGHMFKFDLKSSYHHISIYAPHQTYLSFSWVVNGETKYFVFTVLPKNRFGLHSLRAGGASAAADSGIPDRLLKRHGRWLSDRAKDGYIKDNIMSLLSVTQSWVFDLIT